MSTTLDLPVLTQPDEWAHFFVDYGIVTIAAVEVALGRVGRQHGPELVAELYDGGLLTSEIAAFAVPDAWCGAEFPQWHLSREFWRLLFELAGYTDDQRPADRPTETLRLYRGSTAAGRDGWSWTDSLAVATAYAEGRYRGRQPGSVWTAMVQPSALLARITERNEHEYVVDTDGLTITAR